MYKYYNPSRVYILFEAWPTIFLWCDDIIYMHLYILDFGYKYVALIIGLFYLGD
jgi:hypothetical protein